MGKKVSENDPVRMGPAMWLINYIIYKCQLNHKLISKLLIKL